MAAITGLERTIRVGPIGPSPGNRLEIGSGAEGSVVSEKNRHFGIRIRVERPEGIRKGLGGRRIDGILDFRAA
jgi:hypothetical protein